MSNLLWPGAHRAGGLVDDEAFLRAMVRVEATWLSVLAETGIVPAGAGLSDDEAQGLVRPGDADRLAVDAEAGGNPVIPLVALLSDRLGTRPAARWLHRGLTSQDVVDTALVMCAREATAEVRRQLRTQVEALQVLVEEHRTTPVVARTLTQHAVPSTFGLQAAQWLTGVLDAHDDLAALVHPVQLGGAAGTLAAAVELAAGPARHGDDPVAAATRATAETARRLGLAPSTPWHTVRSTSTRLGDALVRCTDAWGHVANDVLVLSRPEVGELSEGATGGSSTMPHKANPVLSVLLRRAALAAPPLAATLHLAAADAVDARTPGGWHTEWDTLRTLLRRTVVAASQATDLLQGLVVHVDRMARGLAAAEGVGSEQAAVAALTGRTPAGDYLGATSALLEAPLARATALLAQPGDDAGRQG